MPKFSNQLIQGLTNPAYSDKLAQAGMLLGSAPRRAREEEQQRGVMSQVMGTANSAREAAQNGNVAAAQKGLAELNAALAKAPTDQARQLIASQISQVNSYMGAAITQQRKAKQSADAGTAFKLSTVIDTLPEDQRLLAQQKLSELMEDPEIADSVMTRTNQQLDLQEKQAEAKAAAWEQQASPVFKGLVNNGQAKAAYKMADASPYAVEANAMIDAMVDRKSRLDKEAELAADVIKPGDPLIESYRERADLLPTESADSVYATLSKIDDIYKKEDKYGMLPTGSQQRLRFLRGQVKTQLDRYEGNVITTNFNAGVAEKTSVNNQIRKLEMLKIALPKPTKTDLLRVADRLASTENDSEGFWAWDTTAEKFLKKNPEEVFQAYKTERDIAIEQQIQQLREGPVERQLRENGEIISEQSGDDSVTPNKTVKVKY